jgi:hypothetical protein
LAGGTANLVASTRGVGTTRGLSSGVGVDGARDGAPLGRQPNGRRVVAGVRAVAGMSSSAAYTTGCANEMLGQSTSCSSANEDASRPISRVEDASRPISCVIRYRASFDLNTALVVFQACATKAKKVS